MDTSDIPTSRLLPFDRSEIPVSLEDSRSRVPTPANSITLPELSMERKIDDSLPQSQVSRSPNSGKGRMLFPTGIIHNNDPKVSPFSAIGVLPQLSPPSLKSSEDICIFSQERLCDCDSLGAIVFSKTWKGSLVWHFLCNSSAKLSEVRPKGVHLFDINYLKEWLKQKGTEYITCPLCKEGSGTDRKVDEHEIDSLDQLVDRRRQARRRSDLPLQYFVEQLMLAKISETKWIEDLGRARKQEELLRDILRFWGSRQQIPNFFSKIVAALEKSVALDIPTNTRIMLQSIKGERHIKDVCTQLIQIGAKHNSFDCTKLICEEFPTWSFLSFVL